MVRGKVVRFDQVKGYGFITPVDGGEDLFLHVNDLLDEKYLVKPGVYVEYVEEAGDRGPKASSVRLVAAPAVPHQPPPTPPRPGPVPPPGVAHAPGPVHTPGLAHPPALAPAPGPVQGSGPAAAIGRPVAARAEPARRVAGEDDDFVDVLTEDGFAREVTELLLNASPDLTGSQIRAARAAFAELARKYGWIG